MVLVRPVIGSANVPTAEHAVGAGQETAERSLTDELLFGGSSKNQLLPFHRSARARACPPLTQWPTARQLVADGQDTPLSVVAVAPLRLAIGWSVQALPFHRSAKGDPRPPTVVHADAELHDTAASGPPAAGGIRDHERPFHRSANGPILPAVTSVPTATQARAEVHDTPGAG
jgi:hypothetical protein